MSGTTKTSKLDSVPDTKTTGKKRVGKGAGKKITNPAIKAPVIDPPAKMGRPTTFTQEIADRICEGLSIGNSIRTVCQPDDMPAISTFFRWLRTHEDFQKQYAHAKKEAADAMAEDLLDIADDGHNDWMERNYGDTEVWVTNGEALQRSKLRIDTRRWLMAKMKPRVYGDKLDVTSGGEKLPQPILAHPTTLPSSDTSQIIEGEVVDPVKELEQEIS